MSLIHSGEYSTAEVADLFGIGRSTVYRAIERQRNEARAATTTVDEEDDGVISIAPIDGAWPTIDVLEVAEEKAVKNRLHLDLRADGVSTTDEVERLLSLGARPVDVGQEPDVSWVVLADPEGNEFCLLSWSVQEM